MDKLSDRAVALFRGKNFVYLATINPDGSPQVTPLWSDTDGKNIILNTAVGRVKEKNIERDPRVGVSAYDMANPYFRVSLDGKVVRTVRGKRAEDHIDLLSVKYTGSKYTKSSPSEKRVILVIRPTRIREQ